MDAGHKLRLLPERRALADGVYEALLDLLMDHVIEPASRLSMEGIARELGVSPTPVREALARLESEGLVTKRALHGYTATPLLDSKGLRELFEMRRILEPAAARMAAGSIDPDILVDLAELTATMHRNGVSAEGNETRFQEYRDFAEQDAHFHRIIAEHSGNELLADAVVRLRSHMHLYRLYFKHGIKEETADEHEAVLEALRRRDGEAAAAAMLKHIQRSYERISVNVED